MRDPTYAELEEVLAAAREIVGAAHEMRQADRIGATERWCMASVRQEDAIDRLADVVDRLTPQTTEGT